MRKNILTLAILIFSVAVFAVNPKEKFNNYTLKTAASGGGHCFDESTHILNLGVGLGGGNYYRINNKFGRYVSTPAFSISYEHPLPQKVGPGYIGVGAYLAFRAASYRYDYNTWWGNGYYYENRWRNYMITARAAYHWDVLNFEKAEVYGGVLFGLRIQTYDYESNDRNTDFSEDYSNIIVRPTGSIFVGGRYYFTDKIGVYGELGAGVSYANIGLSFKF